jgi:predicted RNA-binding protein with PUA-like domain
MKVQDQAFFYHSNGDPPAIVGTVEVVKIAYPDHYSFEPHSRYFDHKSTPEAPRWLMVDIRLMHVFQKPLSLNQLRQTKGLEKMELLRKGSRLSVQPVRPDEWNIIIRVAGKRVATTRG